MAYAFNDDKSKCQFDDNAIYTLNDISEHGVYQIKTLELNIPNIASGSDTLVHGTAPGVVAYAPVAIAGWSIYSGTRYGSLTAFQQYIDSNDEVYFYIKNHHTSGTASGEMRVYILYMYAG